ncbi:hypothetical protein [Desulfoplanes sp.]
MSYHEYEISEEDALIQELTQYRDKQTIIIVTLINKGFSRNEIHRLLAKIYPENDKRWAKSRLKLYESAYGFLGFFDSTCSTLRINVTRRNINKIDLNEYLRQNNIKENELISLYEKIVKKYDAGLMGVSSKGKERNKNLMSLLKRELANNRAASNSIAPSCRKLTWRAKDAENPLKRSEDTRALWDFARSWIRRFKATGEQNAAERLIYLWVTVNAWASQIVEDMTKNHIDAYLVHCMAKDRKLSGRFDDLYRQDGSFARDVDEFLALGPVFQALWLRNNGIQPWNTRESRKDFVERVFKQNPFIENKNNPNDRYPAFAPACAHDHWQNNETIPVDWPHVLAMIYQVRCNLFHGGKNYSEERDRLFITLAYKILWEVWMDELPDRLKETNKALMPWKRILVRSGFLVQEQGQGFSLKEETPGNRNYLDKILAKGRFGEIREDIFMPREAYVDESLWLGIVEKAHSGAESGRADDLSIMDTYMAGLVRWLHYIGIETSYSCDGHGERPPQIEVTSDVGIALWILRTRSSFF